MRVALVHINHAAFLEVLANELSVIISDTNGGAEVIVPKAGEIIPYRKRLDRLGETTHIRNDPERRERTRTAARQAIECRLLQAKLTELKRVLVGHLRRSE